MFVWAALVTKDLDIVLCVGLLICYTLGTMRVMGGEVTILSAGIQLEVAPLAHVLDRGGGLLVVLFTMRVAAGRRIRGGWRATLGGLGLEHVKQHDVEGETHQAIMHA